MAIAQAKKKRLTQTDWINLAIEKLQTEGIGAVSIKTMSTQLGVTRGSFYHHFEDREQLLVAMLKTWEQVWTLSIREQVMALEVGPIEKLVALISFIRDQGAAEADAPFRAWALHDPLARKHLQQVDKIRLDFMRSLFEAAGFKGLDAENRARLLLYYETVHPAFFARLDAKSEKQLTETRLRLLLNLPEDSDFPG